MSPSRNTILLGIIFGILWGGNMYLMYDLPFNFNLCSENISADSPIEQSVSPIVDEMSATEDTTTRSLYVGSVLDGMCKMITNHNSRKVLARFIVFQRDGGTQLDNLLKHYGRVVGFESIVVIDHLGDGGYTNDVLQRHTSLGVHRWRCEGPWESKAAMWSAVTNVYTSSSEFVFPIDVDEYLAVFRPAEECGIQSLQWNYKELKAALGRLDFSGKPFKMEHTTVLPFDCDGPDDVVIRDGDKNQVRAPSDIKDKDKYMVDNCRMKYTIRRNTKKRIIGCMDKTFDRGRDFVSTDKGNHIGHTKRFGRDYLSKCKDTDTKKYDIFAVSDLALLHLQTTSFADWILHGMRGASDQGLNLDYPDCSKVVEGNHYCAKWQKMLSVNFSLFGLQKLYQEECFKQSYGGLIPIDGVIDQSC